MTSGSSDRSPSNAEKGAANLARLQAWLDGAPRIPERNGVANISAIALASGVDRQVLYRDEAKTMIAAAVAAKGLGMPDQARATTSPDDLPPWAKQKLSEQEQLLAAARAELADLRNRLRRYEAMEAHVTQTGMLPR